MKKLLRLATLCVLTGYVGLVVGEAFHAYFAKDHVEASCAVCQVAHQTPALASGPPVVLAPHSVVRVVFFFAAFASSAALPQPHGRSPPLL